MRLCRHNTELLDISMKKFDDEKLFLRKWQLCELRKNFRLAFNRGYAFAMIVLTWADRLYTSTVFNGLI